MSFIESSETQKLRHAVTEGEGELRSRASPPLGLRPACGPRVAKADTTMWGLAIWTYQAQKAHKDTVGSSAAGSSLSSTARVGRVCQLGGYVGGGGYSRTHTDDDALTVHDMVLRMSGNERALIVRTAAIAQQPDWSPHIPAFRVVPVPGRKGANKGIYDRHGNQIGCEITYEGYPPARAALAVEHAREAYTAWWRALWVLRDALAGAGELVRWQVTGIGAEREPWALK
jgi:hypothetical protein